MGKTCFHSLFISQCLNTGNQVCVSWEDEFVQKFAERYRKVEDNHWKQHPFGLLAAIHQIRSFFRNLQVYPCWTYVKCLTRSSSLENCREITRDQRVPLRSPWLPAINGNLTRSFVLPQSPSLPMSACSLKSLCCKRVRQCLIHTAETIVQSNSHCYHHYLVSFLHWRKATLWSLCYKKHHHWSRCQWRLRPEFVPWFPSVLLPVCTRSTMTSKMFGI